MSFLRLIPAAALVAILLLWLSEPYWHDKSLSQPRALNVDGLLLQDGSDLTPAEFIGHWSLINFGYTHCPDVCPTNMVMLEQVADRIEAQNADAGLRVYLVTVDPKRDSPERLAEYVAFFGDHNRAVWGSDEALSKLAMQTGNVFVLPHDQDGAYSVDHSDVIALLNPEGQVIKLFSPPHTATRLTEEIIRQFYRY